MSTSTRSKISQMCQEIEMMLLAKNEAYGDSALNPVRIFSGSSTVEQINVRLDDKLSRLSRGHTFEEEDTILDLVGYLVLLLIAERDNDGAPN